MTRWGDLESEEEDESEEEEEEEEEEEDTESLADGIASIASGYNSSLPSGIETPDVIDLRKGKAGAPHPRSSHACCHRGHIRRTAHSRRHALRSILGFTAAAFSSLIHMALSDRLLR